MKKCTCHEMPEQQEINGHTRYCEAGLEPAYCHTPTIPPDAAVEAAVVKLTRIAHPTDQGEPTGQLEDAIRDEITHLIATARKEERETMRRNVETVQYGKPAGKSEEWNNGFKQGAITVHEAIMAALPNEPTDV